MMPSSFVDRLGQIPLADMEAYTALWKEFEASRDRHVQSNKQLSALLSGAAAEPSGAAPAHQIREELVQAMTESIGEVMRQHREAAAASAGVRHRAGRALAHEMCSK